MEKVAYILVVGDKEMENKNVALRVRAEGDKGTVDYMEFKKNLLVEIKDKH
jgi:threonyl-tRNA synthetase